MNTQESNKVNATEKLEEVQNELHCSICHDYFIQASTLSCSHSFCFNCINAWRQMHTDCPVCRREILGMAPSRALDNMVAALVDRTNAEAAVQASLQQFGAWLNPAIGTQQRNGQSQSSNLQHDTQQLDDSDFDNDDEEDYDDLEDDEEEGDSYSDGSYDAEEEEYEGEEEEEEDLEEEEEADDDDESCTNSDYDDEEECSDDDEYDEHAKKSNQNNPNNDEYWKIRGWSGRPDNWKELMHRQ